MGLVRIALALSHAAALAFTLTSPAEWLIRELRMGSEAHWGALRLNNLVWYGEAPHNVALAMLPLALLFLYRAIVRGGAWNMVLAGVMSGAVALTNAFGAFGVALGAFSMILALERGVRTVLIVGVCSYSWVSPWLPPSLILWIRRTAWSAEGFFQADTRAYIRAIPAAIAVFAAILVPDPPPEIGIRTFVRAFACLFGVWMCAIPLGYFWFNRPDDRAAIEPLSAGTGDGGLPAAGVRFWLDLAFAILPQAGRIGLIVVCSLGSGFARPWVVPALRERACEADRHHEDRRIQG